MIANGMLALFAVALLGVGTYCNMRIPGPPIMGSTACIVLGTLTCLIILFGIIVLILRQHILDILYIILLVSLFVAQVVVGIISLSMNNDAALKTSLNDVYEILEINTTSSDLILFQRYFECCGFNGPHDTSILAEGPIYLSKGKETSQPYNATFLKAECCPEDSILCVRLLSYHNGCFGVIHETHKDWSEILGLFLIFSSIVIIPVTIIRIKELVIT